MIIDVNADSNEVTRLSPVHISGGFNWPERVVIVDTHGELVVDVPRPKLVGHILLHEGRYYVLRCLVTIFEAVGNPHPHPSWSITDVTINSAGRMTTKSVAYEDLPDDVSAVVTGYMFLEDPPTP